jgi:uncharacterized protein YkwD
MRSSTSLALTAGLAICACVPEDEPPPPEVPPDVEYCAPVRDWDPEWSALEAEVLVLINEHRAAGAECGNDSFAPAEPLSMNPALRCAARIHALDMGARDFFSNLDPDGLGVSDRAVAAGYEGTAVSQNIGANHSTAAQLVEATMGSTGLCAHLMDPEAEELGVGFRPASGASYASYWTQVFGKPAS